MKIKLFLILAFIQVNLIGFAQTSHFRKSDDFSKGLANWELSNAPKFSVVTANDNHGKAVRLMPGGFNTYMLLKNSAGFSQYRVEADVLFPSKANGYLGFIYNYTTNAPRNDYGCIYIKGNENYLWANPHRNGNVSREIYNDYKIGIGKADSIHAGEWFHIKIEVIDSICHFYVNNMQVPKMTFPHFEFKSGMVGFEPRVDGVEVWLDNVTVERIGEFQYKGQPIPQVNYAINPKGRWGSLGPFTDVQPEIEKNLEGNTDNQSWKSFSPDARGCIVSGKVTAWTNYLRTAYFRFEFDSDKSGPAQLYVSSTNNITLWSDGNKASIKATASAWHDMHLNPRHATSSVDVTLRHGKNILYFRVDGQGPFDGYSGDGFFLYLKN